MSDRTCTVEGCNRTHAAKGLCPMHYKRMAKTGTLDRYGVPRDPYANTDLKTCRACGQAKPRTDYTRNADAADGLKGRCRDCENAILRRRYAENYKGMREKTLVRTRKYLYGLTTEDIRALLDLQGHKCALCSKRLGDDLRSFHVDHDHKTKQARGLLCHRCNRAIGFFEDDIENFYRAIRYLQDPPMRRLAREAG